MSDHPHPALPPPPRLEPELVPPPPELLPAAALAPPVPAPTPQEQVLDTLTAAVSDTLHKIDLRAHLELLARVEPKVFRQWVEMALPKAARSGPQQANIINVTNALPKSPLDALPPGFDAHI